jgi:hypothetical protein
MNTRYGRKRYLAKDKLANMVLASMQPQPAQPAVQIAEREPEGGVALTPAIRAVAKRVSMTNGELNRAAYIVGRNSQHAMAGEFVIGRHHVRFADGHFSAIDRIKL